MESGTVETFCTAANTLVSELGDVAGATQDETEAGQVRRVQVAASALLAACNMVAGMIRMPPPPLTPAPPGTVASTGTVSNGGTTAAGAGTASGKR